MISFLLNNTMLGAVSYTHLDVYKRQGVCMLPEGTEMCMPGDNVEMTIELIHPIAMAQGLTFAIREGEMCIRDRFMAGLMVVSAAGCGPNVSGEKETQKEEASTEKKFFRS